MDKVLVIGGGGYIGSVLCGYLLDRGYQVTCFDSFTYGNQMAVSHLLGRKGFSAKSGDIREFRSVNKTIEKHDIVLPLAALVGAPICERSPTVSHEINFMSQRNIFDHIVTDQLIIMPTTNSAYGKGEIGGYCDENSVLKPLSAYAKQKVELEKILMDKQNAISLRLATVFGVSPRMRFDLLVNDFVRQAVLNRSLAIFQGGFRRNYIHVLDVCQAFELAISKDINFRGEIFNVGLSSANLTKLELAELIAGLVGEVEIFDSPAGFDPDNRDYIVSNKKIESYGFEPLYSLTDGIREVESLVKLLPKYPYGNV